MAKIKAGDLLSCEVCGLAVIVDEECGCAAEIICCDEPMMNKGHVASKKKTVTASPKKKAAVKKVKPAPKKKAAIKRTVKKTAKK
jgi:hypothetical protein